MLLCSQYPVYEIFKCLIIDGQWWWKELVRNVGNFRREHFMAEVARASCGDNPAIILHAHHDNHHNEVLNGDDQNAYCI